MHSGDKASPSVSLAGCGHLVNMLMYKMDICVMKTSTCVKVVYSLIVSYSYKSNRKAMNRNWGNQKPNPALKTKAGNK